MTAGDLAWIVSGVLGALFAAWSVLDSLRHRRLGVDVIALLALVGALVVGEYLAAAVISLMVSSGRTLEGWAAGRAHRDLQALLERAPQDGPPLPRQCLGVGRSRRRRSG